MPYEPAGKLLGSPLLPYEKELIRILGCTEQEYRDHVEAVKRKAGARPAEYALIPDIRCEPISTAALISIAVGAALTAASALLAPKPKPPEPQQERRQGKSIRLASRQGAERFGATSGFDTIADLANFAEPIAVVFARRQDNIGGVLSALQLVWSRAFSYGNEQGVKLMYIVGEQGLADGIKRPDLAGIYLGTTPLDGLYANKYAFYWNRNTNSGGRITAKNLSYGSRATQDAGDPQINDDIFLCPSGTATNDTAFSQSYTPTSNTSFGCYGAIANGTGYRVNYELVPLPDIEDEEFDKRQDRLSASARRRAKISGNRRKDNDYSVERMQRSGQIGVGREYGRMMGLQFLNGQIVAPGGPGGKDRHKVKRSVDIGDRATFIINGKVLEESTYWKKEENDVNVDDINNVTIRMREEADDLLQVGQIVMIGRTVWVVKTRALNTWGVGAVGPFETRGLQNIELECIDVFARGAPGNQVGFVSADVITKRIRTDDQGKAEYTYKDPVFDGLTVGPGYFPLMRVSFGLVRNTRACETTEIGIKSQVWNQANGLCNFGSLPTASGMVKADRNGDSLQSGTMNLYFNRTSVFTVFLRPAGVNEAGVQYPWADIGEQFCIQGSRPVDQYNFLRFIHPEIREYEFKFVPKNGADVTQFTPDNAEFWLLDARLANFRFQGAIFNRRYSTPYGEFIVQSAGRSVLKGDIEFAPEMATGTKDNEVVTPIVNAPAEILISEYLPDISDASTLATEITQTGDGWSSIPSVGAQGIRYRSVAFLTELFGQASPFGKQGRETRRFSLRDDRWLEVEFTASVNQFFPPNNPFFPGWRAWGLTGMRVVASSPGMNAGDVFPLRIPISPGNPRNPGGFTSAGPEVQVTRTSTNKSPGGRENAYSYEQLGDAADHPVGSRVDNVFTLNGDAGKRTSVRYSAQVVRAPQAIRDTFGVDVCWDFERIETIPGTTSGNWDFGDFVIEKRGLSDDNPFRTDKVDSFVGVRYQVSGITQERGIKGLSSDRIFEENAQLTDLSNYTERTTSNASGPEHQIVYVSETIKSREFEASYDKLTSCGLALRSGRDFTRVDQLRVWLESGIEVTRFHPDELETIGPSNLLPDLVYYLMTDQTAGIGELLSKELLDLDSFTEACRFLRTNGLYFNGALTEPTNLREYITSIAPFFIIDFAIINGKFSFTPAVPVTAAGQISLGAVPISALFTEGNIIEGSFEVEYLEADQRRDFVAVMRWREEKVNKLPEEKTVSIRWAEGGSESYPIESFDMTDYCCSEEHAIIAAKYLLSLRRRVTHTVSFKTTPEGLSLAPGQYIKVMTQASPYQAADNGVIEADGTLVMARDLDDNVYPIYFYNEATSEVEEGSMTVKDGRVVETALWDTIVTLRYPGISAQIYQVQELTLEEDGLVQIVALEHPTDTEGVSEIARDLVKDSGRFRRGF